MDKRKSVAATTLANSVTVEVPINERWLLLYGHMRNCTLSTGNLLCTVDLRDCTPAIVGSLFSASLATGAFGVFPVREGTLDSTIFGHGVYPLLLTEGMSIRFT